MYSNPNKNLEPASDPISVQGYEATGIGAPAPALVRSLWSRFRELILYGLIGGFCAALDFGVYTVLGLWIPYLWANVISVHCGIFTSFFLNRSLNFKVKDKAAQRFTIFYLVGLSGLALSEGLIWLLASQFAWNPILAKLLTVFVVALYQFLLNKFITFKKSNNG
ncbi:MAG: GtrA family protein [Bacteroidales bacterium]|nr:GtrA family protein [Bacteroidales bacterium]